MGGLWIVNFFAIVQYDLFYLLAIFSLAYILIVPGLLILTFIAEKKLPWTFGITLSVLLSVFSLMILGLIANTILPSFGIEKPLDVEPLLAMFDIFTIIILIITYRRRKKLPLENVSFIADKSILGATILLPIFATFGAIILNNSGSNWLALFTLGFIAVMVFIAILRRKISSLSLSLILYFITVALLLMTSMRGWFLTGHDVHLEYQVFELANRAKLWDIAGFRDAYNACLSITILPTYLQSLTHINDLYLYKIIFQFINALIVIPIFYLSKQYTTKKISFLVGFLYVSFPTFIVDMSMLNRQGMALLFFSAFIFVLLTTKYFKGRNRMILLFLLGTGIILSHYSTSYIAIALLIGGYIIDRSFRFFFSLKNYQALEKLPIMARNKERSRQAKLITLPLVVGLILISAIWTGTITKTSENVTGTIKNIIINIRHPFSQDENSGSAKYSLAASKELTKEELFDIYRQKEIKNAHKVQNESNLYPADITQNYKAVTIDEPLLPLTSLGSKLQSALSFSLKDFFDQTKQFYAKMLQVLIIVGLLGLIIGYKFKKYFKNDVSVEYLSLCMAGVGIMVIQTIFNNVIDYGVLRLFQQNMVLLAIPISLSFLFIAGLIFRKDEKKLLFFGAVLAAFFLILSGFVTQFTGNGRPLVTLNNSGFYYDAYFSHTQEVRAFQWLKNAADPKYPVQSDRYLSNIKMQTYGNVYPEGGLLLETIKKDAFVYLSYSNVKTSNVIEFIGGDVVYYQFPIKFLEDNKNLIYSNSGSKIYR